MRMRAGLVAALLLAAAVAPPAAAETRSVDPRCPGCETSVSGAAERRVTFLARQGGPMIVDYVVLLTDDGAYSAAAPERAPATNENRVDIGGALGSAGGLEDLFDRPLLAFVERGRRIGPVYLSDGFLIADLRGAGEELGAEIAAAGRIGVISRAPNPNRVIGYRLTLDFAPVGAGGGSLDGLEVGDAYLAPGAIILAPPPRELPGL